MASPQTPRRSYETSDTSPRRSALPVADHLTFGARLNPGWDDGATRERPASRYWPFQGVEFTGFVALAAVLVGLVWFTVLRWDA